MRRKRHAPRKDTVRAAAQGRGKQKPVPARLVTLASGYGFARMQTGGDCFVPGRFLNGALPGDWVMLTGLRQSERGWQGEIAAVTEPGDHRYTGAFSAVGAAAWVKPRSAIRFALPADNAAGAEDGDLVWFRVELRTNGYTAVVEKAFGSAAHPRVCADAIVADAEIPVDFSEQAQAQAREAAQMVPDVTGREDLRSCTVFTIDGADAKDLDDAISLWEEDGRRVLGVHIADVSYFVPAGSAVDKEAYARGTSVYFADRVIPMIPPALSNDACSLHPGSDKLAFSAMMTYDEAGECVGFRMAKTVIRTAVRGVYEELNRLWSGGGDTALAEKYRPVNGALESMRVLARQLRTAAARRGTVDIQGRECGFIMDGDGFPAEVIPRAAGEAEEMIEMFMIEANRQTAQLARAKKLPCLYRVHEEPDTEKLDEWFKLAAVFGVRAAKGLRLLPAIQDILRQAETAPYRAMLESRLLRCMAKARYAPEAAGHFGLALADYCHFTSPIRRYPDLLVHRSLSGCYATDDTAQAAVDCSMVEQRAEAAERDCEGCYKAAYISRYIGQAFDGQVSGVTENGLFVMLENTVEGFVPMEELEQAYGRIRFDGVSCFVNGGGKAVLRVGDEISVVVAAADIPAGRIDFTCCPKNNAE